MKIKQEHFDILRNGLKKVKEKYPNARQDYLNDSHLKGDRDKRFRWDALYAAPIEGYKYYADFLCKELYPYLKDDHIDTALRRIVNELWPLN
jgi:hypothetical protein